MKKAKLLGIIIAILLVCSLLFLTSCTGGGNTTLDDGNDKYNDKYDDKWDDPKDEGGKGPENSEDDENDKPSSGGATAGDDDDIVDMSSIDVSKFKIVYKIYDPTTNIYAVDDVYLGMNTPGLFEANVSVYFTYEGLDDYELDEKTVDLRISASEEKVTNDMTFFLNAEQSAYIASEYIEDCSESGFKYNVESLIEEALGKSPSNSQIEDFIENTFTYSDFIDLINDTLSGEITLATSEEIGITEYGLRETKHFDTVVEGTYTSWNRFMYGDVIPWSNFDVEKEIGYYYTDYVDYNGEELIFTFSGEENRERIKSFGFNYTDDGVITDDKFYEIMSKNYDTDKYGMQMEFTFDCPDGTQQTVVFEHYIHDFATVYYDISVPEIASAPLDFENGMTYTFDVTIAGVTHTVTYTTRYTSISPRDYRSKLPGWIGKSGELRESTNTETTLTFTTPDSATFTVTDVPVNQYTGQDRVVAAGVFTFKYGDQTTTLLPDDESCCGINYSSLIDYMKDTASGKTLIWELSSRGAEAKSTPHTVECIATRDTWNNTLNITAYVTLIPTTNGITLANTFDIGTKYYIGEEVYIAPGAMININGIDRFGGESYIIDSVPITKDMIDNFSSDTVGDRHYMYIRYNGSVSMPIYYEVIKDFVVSIKVNAPVMMDVYIIGAPYNFDEFTIDVTYDSGRTVRGVKMLAEYVSAMPTTTGSHTMTVTYEDNTDTFKLNALRAKTAKVQSGLGKYYIKGEKPTEAVIYVVYETNDLGYDYDYVIVGEEVLSGFDTESVGGKTWTYSYAGITISHTYEVKEGAYVVYTLGETNATINGIAMALDEIPDGSKYYSIKSFSELIIPKTLEDLPVTKIASRAFEGLNMITKVVIPEGVTEIGSYAFKDASGIKEVVIPFSATTIGTKIFAGCTNIEKMTVNGNIKIENYFDKEMPNALTIAFNEGVTSIIERCLTITTNGYTIAKVIFPSTLTTIEYNKESTLVYELQYAFEDVASFECAPGGYFSAIDGVLFADGGKTLFCYPMNKADANYTIPDGTEKVLFMAYNLNIKSVVIPASVKELGNGAFQFNENMKSVKFEGSLDTLVDNAFNYCTSLVTFNFPKGIKAIGEYALAYTAIPTVVVPDGVTTIGYAAFYMSKIQKLAIPSSAIDSFAQLGYQCMNSLTDFAYDGSYKITKLKAIFDSFTRDALKNIYVYGVTSFKGGITNGSRNYTIYIDESVKTIEYDNYEFSGNKYYYAGSSITNNSSNKDLTTNASFNQWYEN